jgi:hypothetical protein
LGYGRLRPGEIDLGNVQEENDHLRKQLNNSQEENVRDPNENKSFENIQFKGKE